MVQAFGPIGLKLTSFSVGPNSFRHFTSIFQALPICYLINDRVLVMHGGLPMVDGVVLDDIRKLSRECEPGEQGDFCQNFWNFLKLFWKKFDFWARIFRHFDRFTVGGSTGWGRPGNEQTWYLNAIWTWRHGEVLQAKWTWLHVRQTRVITNYHF